MDKTNSSNSCRVLVIDDEPEMISLVRLILDKGRSDEVIGAVGGQKGIAAAQDRLPDLIILDIMMPEPDGWETCARIKAISALEHIPILFAGAATARHIYPMAKQAGAAGYLQVPYMPDDLLTARDAVLDGKAYYPTLPKEEIPPGTEQSSLLRRVIGLFSRRR